MNYKSLGSPRDHSKFLRGSNHSKFLRGSNHSKFLRSSVCSAGSATDVKHPLESKYVVLYTAPRDLVEKTIWWNSFPKNHDDIKPKIRKMTQSKNHDIAEKHFSSAAQHSFEEIFAHKNYLESDHPSASILPENILEKRAATVDHATMLEKMQDSILLVEKISKTEFIRQRENTDKIAMMLQTMMKHKGLDIPLNEFEHEKSKQKSKSNDYGSQLKSRMSAIMRFKSSLRSVRGKVDIE
jgi:alpha-galactosidase/6-phospho-beta-glucosidase family protein